MPVVTLTSDFGNNDYYPAVLKGALLCANSNLQIIDITHNIKSFDIVQAAYILKNAYPSFPAETIHIISVNNFYTTSPCFVAMRYEEQYFIAPDNGVLSLVFDTIPKDIYEIEYSDKSTFPLEEVYGKVVAHLTSEKPFSEIGVLLDSITERMTFNAVQNSDQLKGTIIHIDPFENVIINITADLFEKARKGRSFQLFYRRNHPITTISNNYADVPVGETLCLFNSSDHLEIAINMGKAASLLGLKVEDTVQIDFMPPL